MGMWKRIWFSLVCALCLFVSSQVGSAEAAGVVVGPMAQQIVDDQTYTGQEQALTHGQQGTIAGQEQALTHGQQGTIPGQEQALTQDQQGTVTGQEQTLTNDQQGTITEQAARGGYRSSPGTYRGGGGTRAGVGTAPDGYRTGPRTPSGNVTNRTPGGTGTGVSPTTGRFGSFFGGLAAGAFLGHLFNPFGYWGGGYMGGGFTSLISLLLWAVLIYLTYRLIKWLFRGRIR